MGEHRPVKPEDLFYRQAMFMSISQFICQDASVINGYDYDNLKIRCFSIGSSTADWEELWMMRLSLYLGAEA